MVKLVGAAVVIAAVVAIGAAAANRWWNRAERRTVNTLTGMSSKNERGTNG